MHRRESIRRVSVRSDWTTGAAFAGVVVALVRTATSWGRVEYSIWPDEPAQLAIARFVGGGTRWNMHDHSIWRPLFGTLLAPVYLVTDDPATVFRVALGLNALLGGVAAALLVVLARRLTPLGVPAAVLASLVVSLAPAVLFTTNFVFAESLVAPLYLATVLALLHLSERPTWGTGVVAGLSAAAAFGAHSRMLPLAIVTLGVLAVSAATRRMTVTDALLGGAVTVGGLVAVSSSTDWIVGQLWNEPSTRNSAGGVLEQLTNGTAVGVSLLGQSWYLLATTLGVVLYGAVALGRAAVGRGSGDGGGPARDDARLVLLTVASLGALSVVFMADRWRSDQLVYGRYNDAVVTPLLVVGIAVLIGRIRAGRLAVLAGVSATATLVSGGVLWVLRRDVLVEGNGLEPMILGLQPFVPSETAIDVVRISVWAAALTVVLAAVALAAQRRQAPWAVAVAAAVLLAIGWVRTDRILDRSWDDSGDMSAVAELRDGVLGDGVPVDVVVPAASNATNRMMLYQFHLPRTEFTVVTDATAGTARFVFARVGDAADADALRDAGAVLVWRDPRGRYGLWER